MSMTIKKGKAKAKKTQGCKEQKEKVKKHLLTDHHHLALETRYTITSMGPTIKYMDKFEFMLVKYLFR